MCDQTEIEYPDGDVVWVKIGACWWPGQVTGFSNLPEDIQREFQKKPLIAAVKFFQEDTYEFVKNYQQIYKYNCTLKDEFIRKGLDKFRCKSKDGASYMDKFPGDVQMAEKLTGGDPDILESEKFKPEEKQDISALFGEKKIVKKKKDRIENRRSEGSDSIRRITHPRFQRGESDHEVRIRQQPSSLPSTPNNSTSPQYPCHLCNFTSSRVNVIICHIKSHRSEGSPVTQSRIKTYSQTRGRPSDSSTPKRKYVRKDKTSSSRSRSQSGAESGKRKQNKQIEKVNKKRKTDPELREKLLADWDDESDEDTTMDVTINSSLPSPSKQDASVIENKEDNDETSKDNMDGSEILAETEKLLKDTDSLIRGINDSKSKGSGNLKTNVTKSKKDKENSSSDSEAKTDKDDKKSRLACFDFDEEDLPEPSIPPVRKIPRVFGEKNLSLKKEIIREFEMSQALKTEQEKEVDKDQNETKSDLNEEQEQEQETIESSDVITDTELLQAIDSHKREMQESKLAEKNNEISNEVSQATKKSGSTEKLSSKKDQKTSGKVCETEVEIVEIFEVEREEDDQILNKQKELESVTKTADNTDKSLTDIASSETDKEPAVSNIKDKSKSTNTKQSLKNSETLLKETDDTLSENVTTETEDETVSESVPEQSEQSDTDVIAKSSVTNLEKDNQRIVKRRRGRPRKNFGTSSISSGKNDISTGNIDFIKSPWLRETMEAERKTSESDTERSYTGRKRKPNKKYLESDIYVQDPDQKAFKTDESLSESDDRSIEKPRGRGRRGRKPGYRKKFEAKDQAKDLELELSDQFLGPVDDTDLSRIHRNRIRGRKFVGLEERLIVGRRSHDSDEDFEDSEESPAPQEPVSLSENKLEDSSTMEQEKESKDSKSVSTDVESNKILDELDKNGITEEKVMTVDDKSSKKNSKDSETQRISDSSKMEMLPPKKSQIKKFELSQIDFFDNDSAEAKAAADSPEKSKPTVMQIEAKEGTDKEVSTITEISETKATSPRKEVVLEVMTTESTEEENKETTAKELDESVSVDDVDKKLDSPSKRNLMQTRYKGKFTPETGTKSKKEKEGQEEKSINTFQEAFLKTLSEDKKKVSQEEVETIIGKGKKGKKVVGKRKADEMDSTSSSQELQTESADESVAGENVKMHIPENVSNISLVGGFEGVEVVVEENIEIDTKSEGTNLQSSTLTDQFKIDVQDTSQGVVEDNAKSINVEVQKVDETAKASVSASPSTSDVNVPVKKREMPRIIENVTLTEAPMQILKTKLLDKLPVKSAKHKLEQDSAKKCSPRRKIMKLEPVSPSSKTRTGTKITSPHLSLTKKLQVLKAEEAETAAQLLEAQNEKLNVQTSQTLTAVPVTEKYIQQSSQSLADMELDINSMPFVLSEDVLTPEGIEQMPVVISSIIPASTSLPTTITLTPTTQIVSANQAQYKLGNESGMELATSPKKKSGTPAILKNKSKAKPTITSIKTIVPPLTGGVKGLKFQNTQASKTPPLLIQKNTPGKYVVVTAGGQQLRYSVQGKSSPQQKIAISAGKTAGNVQVVQQGGKVVILNQSGQNKMLPLNITKTLGGKVQKIVTSKGQIYCPISPQGQIISSKTMIVPKSDVNSPTTSKLSAGHKIINTQGIITSKGVLTPIGGGIGGKTALLGTVSQGILTKGGIYTPISALGGKTIIGSKTLVTKGATIISPQNLGGQKTILTPISQSISGKTILTTQNIVGAKGTVLTPITGQQVKAIAAKSPTKGGKVQYQNVQQKVQLPVLQKSPKGSMPVTQQARTSGTAKPGTLILQNTASSPKGIQTKKIIKQTIVQQGSPMRTVAPQTVTQQTIVQQKGKAASSPTVQKVVMPRGRQSKAQQKIVVQKIQEPIISTVQNVPSRHVKASPSSSTLSKPLVHHKGTVGSSTSKSMPKTQVTKSIQPQKNVLSAALNSVVTTSVLTSLTPTLSLPPLEPIEQDKGPEVGVAVDEAMKKEQLKMETSAERVEGEKVEEAKVAVQPQIMALPTESSDGTQTYVLVTIDEQGHIQPLDNNTLMSLEGTTQNPDGTRTLYIDPSSLGEAGTLDNIVLQFDNGMSNIQTGISEPSQSIMTESFPSSEIIQTSNQDILAAALANTDFQQEINLPENQAGNVMSTGLTQTSLINQTILQSTIIPPTEPISSPSVLETSLTLNQPIMTPLEVPSNLPIQSETASTSVVSSIPSSLELPITITNPSISYISSGEAQIQIPGNSMPDIGEIMETSSSAAAGEIPASTQYLVIPNLGENIAASSQAVQSETIPAVTYSVSIPNNIVLETTQAQTTPSMPIIDDSYAEDQFATTIPTTTTVATEQTFVNVPVSEMLVSKATSVSAGTMQAQDVTATGGETAVVSQEIAASSQETTKKASVEETDGAMSLQEAFPSHEASAVLDELATREQQPKQDSDKTEAVTEDVVTNTENVLNAQVVERASQPLTSSMPIIDDSNALVTSESNLTLALQVQDSDVSLVSSESNLTLQQVQQDPSTTESSHEAEAEAEAEVETEAEAVKLKDSASKEEIATAAASSGTEGETVTVAVVNSAEEEHSQVLPAESMSSSSIAEESMEVSETVDSKIYPKQQQQQQQQQHDEEMQIDEPTSQEEISSQLVQNLQIEETVAEGSLETPSQSYEQQFDMSITGGDSADLPTQSASKSENSREPSQSIAYEPMEIDEETATTEPPTQSFEDSKRNEASQSRYDTCAEENTNAPTQSFNEIMQSQDERVDEPIDDQSFPTQSYEVGKLENLTETLETDAEISQEGNIPSQSNDIGADGIGTSSVSTNNSGLNEDETASSSYVPETPENQERDQDQESAISTSSYEIPPCEELNIASSSVIPDTSVRAEHTSIHDNGVPEIPTSSYNLNPDITSTHVDSVPTSSYEDQVIVEQNVSTSYEVPISMPGLDENSSQNFVTESTNHRNEPSSYYAQQEVTASYYESVDQNASSRLEEDAQEEVTRSYYEGNPQEASQSYFTPEEATPSYSSHNVSPSYYDPRPESEASQSYYSTDDLEKTDQSSSQNIEASQSFYQERTDELRLRQQGEATPTYSERYPVDYPLDNSPIERHDLVESSVPATRSMER